MSIDSDNLITFPHDPSTTNDVSVAGAFSNWEPLSMKFNQDSNEWQFNLYDYLISHHTEDEIVGQKIMYKFILNGDNWCCNILKPIVKDESGNDNNVLTIKNKKTLETETMLTDLTGKLDSSSVSSQSPSQQLLDQDIPSSLSSIHLEEEEEVTPTKPLDLVPPVGVRDVEKENLVKEKKDVSVKSEKKIESDQSNPISSFFHWLWQFLIKIFGGDTSDNTKSTSK